MSELYPMPQPGTPPLTDSLGGSAKLALERARRRWIELSDLNWRIVLLLYTLGAFISAGTTYTAVLAEGGNLPYFYPLVWELTGYFTHLALLPLIVLGFGRFPIGRANWFWTVPLLMLFSAAFGASHTSFMFLSRRAVYAVLGLGTYDYGQMGYRFLMEYHKQLLLFWGIYVVLRSVAHYRQGREREQQAAALELKASELQKELAQVQLHALRSQLNPHFLFNTLNMISSVMYDDVARADQMIATLSRMLRMSLEERVEPRVPVRRELEFVQCAAELIRARFQERVEITISCRPDTLELLVPNLLLYTFIENSIKHHDFERDPLIRVEARIERHAGKLEIHVLDNGPGIGAGDEATSRGVGLSNTRQRLAALYRQEYQLELLNRPEGGLHVRAVIPLEESAPNSARPGSAGGAPPQPWAKPAAVPAAASPDI